MFWEVLLVPGLDIDNVQTSIAPDLLFGLIWETWRTCNFVNFDSISFVLYYAVCTQLSNYVRVARGAVFCLFQTQETISDVLIYPRESQPRCLTGEMFQWIWSLGWGLWRCWVWLLLCWTDRNQLGSQCVSVSPVFTRRAGRPNNKTKIFQTFYFLFISFPLYSASLDCLK